MKPTEFATSEEPGDGLRDLEALFERCLDVPGPERARFLLHQCREDETLLVRALDLLLAAYEAADLQTPVWLPAASSAGDEVAIQLGCEPATDGDPLSLPGFRVLNTLGEGGMGTVYLAEQLHPVRRRVALKVARTPLGEHGQARLSAERQVMARLFHPHVAQIFEAGSTADGRPYFAMEWIDGAPITEACDRGALGIDERLRLFLDVCAGVQHAHQKGILHRDLKPSNVMVTESEGRLAAKIIDFGVAKAMDETLLGGLDSLTQGSLVGTPAYMSPEVLLQAPDERSPAMDTRSDVYSLGVLLYELLVGERPVPREPGENPLRYLRRIAEGSVASPRRRWDELDEPTRRDRAAERGSDPRSLDRRLRGDLEWIVMKATARDPEARYPSVSELAADVERHLVYEPVLAGPPSTAYRLRKFTRRHRAAVAAAALVFLALGGGLVARSVEAARANREAAEARLARDESARMVDFLFGLFEDADPVRTEGRDLRARDLLRRGAEDLTGGDGTGVPPRVRSRLLMEIARVYWSLGDPREGQRLAEIALELRQGAEPRDDAAVAESLYLVGTLAGKAGDYDRAEALLRHSLAERERLFGTESPEAVDLLVSLGLVHEETQRYSDAEVFYRRALAVYEARGETRTREAANVVNNLGVVFWRLGRHDEAATYHRRALGIRQEIFSPGHPSIALSFYNLGQVHLAAGRFEQAEAALAEARHHFEKIYGADHPDVGRTVNSQGSLFQRTGRWAEAEAAYRRVLEIYEEAFGHEHLGVVFALYNLGQTFSDQARFDEALPWLQEALAVEEGLDPDGIGTSMSRVAVAQALRPLGRLDEAEALLERARSRLEGAVGEEEEGEYRQALVELGRVELSRGRHARARSWFEAALEHGRAITGEDSARGPALLGLAGLARLRGADAEARKLAFQARDATATALPRAHYLVQEIERFLERTPASE